MRPTHELVDMGIVEVRPNGSLKVLNREAFFNLPELRFPLILAKAYQDFHCLDEDVIPTEEESERLVTLFSHWVADGGETNDLEEQYRTLGIMDIKGKLNEDRLYDVAWKIFELEDHSPDFNLLLNHLRSQSTK